MQFLSLFALAVGLAMDATAVAAAKGFATPDVRPSEAIRMGVFFGGFQALMPLVGWAAGEHFATEMAAWDHWIAFILLAGIGLKMIWEALKRPSEGGAKSRDAFDLKSITLLAFATSIDALVAGLTLPMLDVPVFAAVLTIGLVTALLSVAGVYLGRRFGAHIGRELDAFGGLVLIALGTKMLIEHLGT